MAKKFKIVCPSCRTVLEGDYADGIEQKSVRCPKCGQTRAFSAYRPYLNDEDKTELGDMPAVIAIGGIRVAGSETMIPLKSGRNSIGRKAGSSVAAIQIEDPTNSMSREHCFIDVIAMGGTVTHILSESPSAKNKTLLDGVRIEKSDRLVLKNGDKVTCGQVTFEFVLRP